MVEPSKGRIVASFAVMLVIATVLMAAILWALDRFAGAGAGSGGIGIVPPMVAAIVAGQRHAMATGGAPRGGYAWAVAAWFVAVTIALSMAGLGLLHLLNPGPAAGTGDIAMLLIGGVAGALALGPKAAMVAGILLLILWAVLRWGYSFGARIQLKARAKR